MKQVLLRLNDTQSEALRQAAYNERLTSTEILRQALAIWLQVPRGKRTLLLEKVGYQEQRLPEPLAAANGQGPEKPPKDDWSLE